MNDDILTADEQVLVECAMAAPLKPLIDRLVEHVGKAEKEVESWKAIYDTMNAKTIQSEREYREENAKLLDHAAHLAGRVKASDLAVEALTRGLAECEVRALSRIPGANWAATYNRLSNPVYVPPDMDTVIHPAGITKGMAREAARDAGEEAFGHSAIRPDAIQAIREKYPGGKLVPITAQNLYEALCAIVELLAALDEATRDVATYRTMYAGMVDVVKVVEAERDALAARCERLQRELTNIRDVKPEKWIDFEPEDRMEQFRKWAQNRARAALKEDGDGK